MILRVGVRSATLTVIVLLLCVMTILVSVLSVSTTTNAVENARTVGDDAVALCLEGGRQNVMSIVSFYVSSTLNEATASVDSFLQVFENALKTHHEFVKGVHPDVVTSPTWLTDTLRQSLFATHQHLSSQGGYFAASAVYPFSPNSLPAWGGLLVYFSVLRIPLLNAQFPDDYNEQAVLESREQGTNKFQDNNRTSFTLGSTDSLGYLDDKDGNQTDCLAPGFNLEGNVIGVCEVSADLWFTAELKEELGRAIDNAQYDDGAPLHEPDMVSFSPIIGVVDGDLTMLLSLTWTHPEMINRYPRQNHRVGSIL
eukprot:gene18621-28713_t